MTWSDLASRALKTVIALVSAVVMDYAFLNGRMTRQAVAGTSAWPQTPRTSSTDW
jgi:hypothetical protein